MGTKADVRRFYRKCCSVNVTMHMQPPLPFRFNGVSQVSLSPTLQ